MINDHLGKHFEHHHVLPKQYGTFTCILHSHSHPTATLNLYLEYVATVPVPLYIFPWYLRNAALLVSRLCYEHGLIHTLQSQSNHSLMIQQERQKNLNSYKETQVEVYFEFYLLAFGWTVASLTFIVELVSVSMWPWGLIAGSKSKSARNTYFSRLFK